MDIIVPLQLVPGFAEEVEEGAERLGAEPFSEEQPPLSEPRMTASALLSEGDVRAMAYGYGQDGVSVQAKLHTKGLYDASVDCHGPTDSATRCAPS